MKRIMDAEALEAIALLVYWVNAMHFAALVMRYILLRYYPTSLIFTTLGTGNRNKVDKPFTIYLIRSLRIWVALAMSRLEFRC